jgi:predicted double-glycine peptidase
MSISPALQSGKYLPVLLIMLLTGCAEFWDRGPRLTERHTVKELRDQYVVKQERDYSCGSAALATLLIHYYGDDTSEKELLELLLAPLSQEEKVKKSQRGFSLLDLKRVAVAKGYRAAGFRLTIQDLARLTAPVMAFVEPLGYKHFAVVRGVDRGRVFLADPARGNLRMGVSQFLQEWSGIVFVLGKEGEEKITDHPLALRPPGDVQPETVRFNAQLELGMLLHSLPLR